MARYALADHVFVCLNGEHLVLLDVKEDRYWALEAAQTAGLGFVGRRLAGQGPARPAPKRRHLKPRLPLKCCGAAAC